MPGIGNVPKLAMAVAATAMACCAYRRRWVAAGFFGALAFWDWQIGAWAWVVAFLAACLTARPRVRACLRVIAGGALGTLPFLGYYAVHGALGAVFDQVIVASFFRGASSLEREGLADRWERMRHLIEIDCPGRGWLFFASLAGLVVALAGLWILRRDERLRLLLPLVLYHVGVGAFSLFDFQWHGDLFSLLLSVAFLQGLAWVGLWLGLKRLAGRGPPALRWIAAGTILVVAVWVCRPGPLHAELDLELPWVEPGTTLADQVDVAERLRPRLAAQTFALVEFSELLFLLRLENPVPFIYWNNATWSTYRQSPSESKEAALARLLRELDVELLTYKQKLPAELLGARYAVESVASKSGRYVVYLQVRRAE